MEKYALELARKGIPVFPCHSSKKPATTHGFKDATTDTEIIRAWWRTNPDYLVAFPTGTPSGISVLDVDVKHGKDGIAALSDLEDAHEAIKTKVLATQSGGAHLYFTHIEGLVNSAGAIAPGLDVRGEGGYVIAYQEVLEDVPLAPFPPWLKVLAEAETYNPTTVSRDQALFQGARNHGLFKVGCRLRTFGLVEEAIAAVLAIENQHLCDPPLPELEVKVIAKSAARYSTSLDDDPELRGVLPTDIPYPDLPSDIFYGPVADVVRVIGEQTEADPLGIFAQTLVACSTAIGRGCWKQTERDLHYPNSFICLVGETAKGRKGVSWGHAREALRAVDSSLRVRTGMSTGEGIIHMLRDPEKKIDDPRTINEMQDKRLVLFESELGRVLKAMKRETNTLSAILRDAWDGRDLHNLSVVNKAEASDPCLSIIGHVTRDELMRQLEDTDTANGFANRFLWLCVRRMRKLPFGGEVDEAAIGEIHKRLESNVSAARKLGRIRWAKATRSLWAEWYTSQPEHAGLTGALNARSEAHCLRLSMMHAALEGSQEIQPGHLKAAIALVRYSEDSVRYLFQNRSGDALADKIMLLLQEAESRKMTRTELSKALGRNYSSERIDGAILMIQHRLTTLSEVSRRSGKPTIIYQLK